MKTPFLSCLILGAVLTLGGCNNDLRTDGTAGEAVSDMDQAADEGGVKADAVVIDNSAGPTITASPDSALATDSSAAR